jgi:acetone carboxylase gamma subunit
MNKETVRELLAGDLSWERLQNEVLSGSKDPRRFETVIEVLQERTGFDEPILVPINDHLFVVGTDDGRQIRGECGHDFCTVDENWKEASLVRVREAKEEVADLYSEWQAPDEDWTFQLREFFCPSCKSLLEVDAVPACYPVIRHFEPDIDVFYEEWLGKPAPDRR